MAKKSKFYRIKTLIRYFVIDNSFELFRVFIFVCVIILFILVIVSILPGFYFPNLFNIIDIQILSNLLMVIIGSLSSVLGIIVAIILVALEILRKRYDIYAHRALFKNISLIELISFYAITILISFYTLLTLSNPLSIMNISFGYLSVFLFTISIIILFPYSYKIITATQSKSEIRKIVSTIDFSAMGSLGVHRGFVPSSFYILRTETNPYYMLVDIGTRALRNNDLFTPKLILSETFCKLKELLANNPKDKRGTLNSFIFIFNNISNEALRQNSIGTLQMILNIIEEIHEFKIKIILPGEEAPSEEKFKWHELIEFNEYTETLLDKILKAKLDGTAKEGLYMLEKIALIHLKEIDIGKDKKIEKDDEGKDFEKTILYETCQGLLINIIDKAISLDRREVFFAGFLALRNLVGSIFDISLDISTKRDLIISGIFFLKKLTLKSIDTKDETTSLFYTFNHLAAERFLEKDKELSKLFIEGFGNTLIELAKKNALDRTILNELGTLARGCTRKISKDKIFIETIMFIIGVFNQIREIIENEYNDKNRVDYITIYKQLNSINEWIKDEDEMSNKIKSVVKSNLENFKLLKGFTKRINKDYIEWPNINSS